MSSVTTSSNNDLIDNNNNNENSSLLNPPLSSSNLNVHGRCFIITGGTQGLGLSIARLLIKQGAIGIALISRNQEKGKLLCNELTTSTCKCVYIYADLSIAIEASSIVPKSVELLKDIGYVSGIVNAAATTARGNLMTETTEGFDYHMALNVRAPFLITKEFAKYMIKNNNNIKNGSIVNICSCASYGGAPFIMAYTASKAALSVMTKTNAHELAKHNIRVNGINMGWCYTDNENIIQQRNSNNDPNTNWVHNADQSVPLGRILRPDDVAVTVNFLLSNASNMMTASILELHPEYPYGMISLAVNENDGR